MEVRPTTRQLTHTNTSRQAGICGMKKTEIRINTVCHRPVTSTKVRRRFDSCDKGNVRWNGVEIFLSTSEPDAGGAEVN
jgi:hypothetical protein